MCGIAGVITLARSPDGPSTHAIPDAWLDALDRTIAHRGPDGHGRFRDSRPLQDGRVLHVALVHRRLSILDHAGGGQPMVDPDASRAIVFNGMVYNHRDLRRELLGLGEAFASDHSDTEAILVGWRRFGAALLPRLDAMFALAIWDAARPGLVLARDPAGEKPLYYDASPDGAAIAFASSMAGLRALGRAAGWPWRVDPASLACWIRFGWWTTPPVGREVAPGEALAVEPTVDGLAVRVIRARPPAPARAASPPMTDDELGDAIARAVRSRLDADVPMGCFLSGGVDSSLVALHASRHAREAGTTLRTFTVRMTDAALDESAYGAEVARILGTRHQAIDAPAEPAADLTRLIAELGLPFADSSLLPTHWLARAVRREVAAAIGGDGGDELFLGYDRYRAARWLARAGTALARLPAPSLASPARRLARAGRLVDAARHDRYLDLLSIFPTSMLSRLVPGAHQASSRIDDAGEPDPNLDPGAWDFRAYLPGDLMRKVDSATMSVALEARSPLLAGELVGACLRAPVAWLTPGGERKGRLRRIARRHFPRSLVDRPKAGFAIPIGRWFREDHAGLRGLLTDALGAPDPFPASRLGLEVDRAFVRSLLDDHLTTRADHSQRLYALLVLALWARDA